jgi:formylglycine-generating enzyme required for sulfatase activity
MAPETGGYLFERERGRRMASCPDHDIDAQPVSWQQFLEFVADGGYRQSRWWSPVGWDWVCQQQRRGPSLVEDLANGLVQTRFGQTLRIHPQHPVVQVNAHEAQAWCRWAGRRLPSEVEWAHAAERLSGRGFRWGEVWEWTADRLVALEQDLGDCNLPQREAFLAACSQHRVLRGGATVTRARLRDARHRHHRLPEDTHGFTGFRSCAL